MHRISLLALPFFVAGCLTNDNSPPTADSGATVLDAASGVDATVPDSAIPDGGVPDTFVPDAAPVDAGPKPVTMRVLKRGVPESGVTVVFGDASGAILASATTDATGSASQLVPAGGQVTAIFGTVDAPQFVTVQGVKPGDALALTDSADLAATTEVSIDSVPANPPAGTSGYFASAGSCSLNFTAPPAQFFVGPECQNGGKLSLLIVALDASVNNPLGYTFVKDVSLAPDGGLPDGGVLSVNASGAWSTTVTQTITATHAPVPDAGGIFASLSLAEVANGLPSGSYFQFDPAGLDGGSPSNDFEVHAKYADFVQSEGTLRTSIAGGIAYQAIATRHPAPSAKAVDTIDLAQLLPAFATATVDSTDLARPSAAFTTAGSVASADGLIVQIRWSVPLAETNGGVWTIITAPDATSVKAPLLPASLSSWLPTVDTVTPWPVIAVVDASFVTGYDQLRAAASGFAPSQGLIFDLSDQIVPPLPVDGTLRLTGFTFNNGT